MGKEVTGKRIIGIETEYGLYVEGHSASDQMEDASEFIKCLPFSAFKGWDYSFESPRNDIRGFKVDKLAIDPIDAQWDEGRKIPESQLREDRVLTNGARFYNDHGHPEYSTPECSRLLDLVAHDLAGEKIVNDTAIEFEKKIGKRVKVYKNNSDFHGASYGTHENYLVSREVSKESLIQGLLPFLVVRQILVGAGKVGSEVGKPCKYQISQRSEFFHEVANVETLYRRPIFNTRDEAHCDSQKWIRLHVICGDANRMPWCTAMKTGMSKLALDLIELGECPKWRIKNPVREISEISKDESYKWKIELEGSSWTTALEILESYLRCSEHFLKGRDNETDWIISEWRQALEDLPKDKYLLKDRVDWVAKLSLLEDFAFSEGKWKNDVMQSLDLEYHNIDKSESLFHSLQDMGLVKELVNDSRVQDAVTTPPQDTRAKIRGDLIRESLDNVKTVCWRRAILKDGSIQEFEV